MRKTVKFNNKKDIEFKAELNKKVEDYLKSNNFERNHSSQKLAFTIFLILIFSACMITLTFIKLSLLPSILLLSIVAISQTILLANLGHELGHNAMSRHSKVNKFLFKVIFNLGGIDSFLWKHTHNLVHHPFPNIPGYDFDIQGNDLLRMGPHEEHQPIHRYQHIYAPFLYTLFFLNKFFVKDFKTFQKVKKQFVKTEKEATKQYRLMIFHKARYLFSMIGAPFLLSGHSLSTIIITFILFHFVTSLILAFTLGGAHSSTHNHYHSPNAHGELNNSYFRHQIETNVDFYAQSKFWGLLFGGINAHAAHHLYPQMTSAHYPKISEFLEELCPKYGIKYINVSLLRLYIDHWKYLRELAHNSNQLQDQLIKTTSIGTAR